MIKLNEGKSSFMAESLLLTLTCNYSKYACIMTAKGTKFPGHTYKGYLLRMYVVTTVTVILLGPVQNKFRSLSGVMCWSHALEN